MKMHWKRRCVIAMVTGILLLFAACDYSADTEVTTQPPDEPITLRLLVDWARGPNKSQLDVLIASFEDTHENVTIEVETLEDDIEAREVQMQQLRVEIMAGRGPDLFLFFEGKNAGYQLFPDLNQVMRNAVFADLSTFYDQDDALEKEGLNAAVMDAGVVDGKRYVLPLCYNFPVVYYDKEKLAKLGLLETVFQGDAAVWMKEIMEIKDGRYAADLTLWFNMLNYFPEVFDYEAEEVLITREDMVSYLEICTAFEKARDDSLVIYGNAEHDGYYNRTTWTDQGDLFWLGDLKSAINEYAFAQANGIDLDMCPMVGEDGKITAEVRTYGAVGAGCAHPELGYAFLREFLTVESQWEKNNGRGILGGETIRNCYPVRSADSAEDYYQVMMERGKNTDWTHLDPDGSRRAKLEAVEIHNEDFPIFAIQPDAVRFPLAGMENTLYVGVREIMEGTKTAEEVADEWLRSAMFRLAEG